MTVAWKWLAVAGFEKYYAGFSDRSDEGCREKQINQSLTLGPEQLCEWCAIYKGGSGSLGEEQVCWGARVGGREDVLRIQSFILSTLLSCCPFAVQMEISGRLLAAGTCLWTVVVKTTASGTGTSGFKLEIHSSGEPHCLTLLIWKMGW